MKVLWITLIVSCSLILWGCHSSEKKTHHADHHSKEHHGHHHGKNHAKASHHKSSHHAFPHRFDDAEKWAKKFDDPQRHVWQKPKEVIGHMKIQPGMTVADIGAGTGYFVPYLSEAVGTKGKVLAIDVEKNLVEHMNQRFQKTPIKNITVQLGQYDDPQLPAQSVDRMLIVDVWHHISEREAYAQKLRAALKPGGVLYIVDFEKGAGGEGPSDSHRLETQVVLKELSNFNGQVITETLPYQYIIRAK